jgi:hypothetical protein
LIAGRGLLLPPYRPDINPVETGFVKLEALLRNAAERVFRRNLGRLRHALDLCRPVSPEHRVKPSPRPMRSSSFASSARLIPPAMLQNRSLVAPCKKGDLSGISQPNIRFASLACEAAGRLEPPAGLDQRAGAVRAIEGQVHVAQPIGQGHLCFNLGSVLRRLDRHWPSVGAPYERQGRPRHWSGPSSKGGRD